MEKKFVDLDLQSFLAEAKDIVNKAQEKGLYLRIIGALAVYLRSEHSPQARDYFFSLGRLGEGKPLFTDLDLVAYSRQSPELKRFLERELHFKPNPYVNAIFANKRSIFTHPEGKFDVDVFYDKLDFSHIVDFGKIPGKGRLELDFPTISLADIVLEKLQIHQINRKDLIDLFVLLLSHEIGPDKEMIDSSYIAKKLAGDWGFYYDATQNLQKLSSFVSELATSSKVGPQLNQLFNERLHQLTKAIEEEPKDKGWIKRAKIGTNKLWFKEVEEVDR